MMRHLTRRLYAAQHYETLRPGRSRACVESVKIGERGTTVVPHLSRHFLAKFVREKKSSRAHDEVDPQHV